MKKFKNALAESTAVFTFGFVMGLGIGYYILTQMKAPAEQQKSTGAVDTTIILTGFERSSR